MYLNTRALFAVLLVACVISGCEALGPATWQMLMSSIKPQADDTSARLNPAYQHLRIFIKGRSVFVTLGDREDHPDGAIDVYYSTGREVIRLQNGRIVGTAGLLAEWRNVSVQKMPNWAAVARAREPVLGERVRDVMPGYRYGIRDKLIVSKIANPVKSPLVNVNAESLTWFEERHENAPAAGTANWFFKPAMPAESLPPARYAVDFSGDRETVVYGEQCLAPDLCFSWQRWIPRKP